MNEAEQAAEMKRWYEYTDWLVEKGWMQAGDALADIEQATSVRVRDGERIVTDGPFAETKETLGGYYLLEVDNLDDAIEAAAQCPGRGTARSRCARSWRCPEPPQA